MAQEKQQQGADNNDAHWRAFGLRADVQTEPDPEPQDGIAGQDEDSEGEGESEGQETDASQENATGEALADLNADRGDAGEEGPSEDEQQKTDKQEKKYTTIAAVKRDLDAEVKKREAAEKQMRSFQADKDRIQNQLNVLQNQFMVELNRLKAGQTTNTNEGELPDVDDEAVIDGKTLKNILSLNQKKSQAKESADAERAAQQAWVTSQADIQAIRDYSAKHNWQSDPQILNIPTNTVGLVWVARAKMAEEKLAGVEDRIKQEVAKAVADERKKLGSRKPIPTVGGGSGGQQTGGTAEQPANDLERRYLKYFGGKIVQRGR